MDAAQDLLGKLGLGPAGKQLGVWGQIAERIPAWLRPIIENPLNLALLLLLLYLLVPLLIPSFLFDPSTSAHFLNHYPTLAQAKLRGIPSTKASPETQRRWRNYLRRLRSAGADSKSSGFSSQMATDLRLQSVRRKAGIIDASSSSTSTSAAKSTYSLLPAYHPPSIKWTVYTPRTLAVHDGTGLSLSESDVRATYDERRDGPGSAGSAAEQRKKAVAQAHARLGNASASSKGKGREELDEEEAETEIGGYADPDGEGAGAGGADPSKRILLAIEGEVYDVTRGKNFYGPGGPYAIFAGRDASIGMAKQSFDLEMLTPLDQPIAKLDSLTPMELSNMRDWKNHFAGKYGIVGKLVNEGEEHNAQ